MNAAYLQPEVSLDAGRTLRADFELRNDSAETWRADEGFAVGYHLFDAETGTLIVDGARVHPAGEVPPGAAARVHLEIAVPPEDGRYQVLLSPMRENVCWYYEQGWPFLLVEAATREGRSSVAGVRVATASTLRRERALRSLGRAFVLPFRTIWKNRGLIRVMVRRDILGRYRGSFGGAFWTVINPLLLMLTYFFVFGVVLRARFGGDDSRSSFALYFLAGMLPWLAFSEAAGRAPTVMLEHRNFVKKLVFAVETLPVNLVVAGLVTEFFAVLLYCGFLVATRGSVPATVAWLPVLILPQVLFTAGLAWFLAALGVFVRDLGQIIGFLLTLWFFVTPICYPESQWNGLPARMVAVLGKNPIFILVHAYRGIFLEHAAPAFGPLWKLGVLGLILFLAGHAWFYKLRKSFPDLL
ncbi:MAG: ABC transporter permease [Acidobacteria bacterium]|nr:ABC transporter permease [Acidobacteriota bacterium]